jgi:hypothetical protein
MAVNGRQTRPTLVPRQNTSNDLVVNPLYFDEQLSYEPLDYEQTMIWIEPLEITPTTSHDGDFQNPDQFVTTTRGGRSSLSSVAPQLALARSNSWHATSESTPPSEVDLRTVRRRAQNRLAQRTYRARKENAIKEHSLRATNLEKEVTDLKAINAKLMFGMQRLKGQVGELQQNVSTFPIPQSIITLHRWLGGRK